LRSTGNGSTAWTPRDEIRSEIDGLLPLFADRFGYPPGVNGLAAPASRGDLAELASLLDHLGMPDDLTVLYSITGGVPPPA
jgi:hypothetical protein